jgi:hypothetical protein
VRALALAALALCGCALSAEGEIPDVEVTRHGVMVPGVPLEARIGDPVVSVPVSFDPRDQISLEEQAYRSVKVSRVTFTMTSANADLSFVRTLHMTVHGVTATAPIELIRYQRSDGGPPVGATLDIPLSPPVEILPAWQHPPCVLLLEVQGALPEDAWRVDVTVHFAATVGL